MILSLFSLLALCQQANAQCPSPRVRRAWRDLDCNERQEFIDALTRLKATGDYDIYDEVHQTNGATSHGTEEFLPWHRWFLLKFENSLRQVSGTCLTVPYWDWERDSNSPRTSVVTSPTTFGESSDTGCINTGVAGGWRDSVGSCLSRTWGGTRPVSESSLIGTITRSSNYATFRVSFEATPHSAPHIMLGGTMNSFRSPADPLFWLHHANVDRVWAIWQQFHGYSSMTTPSGNAMAYSRGLGVNSAMQYSSRSSRGRQIFTERVTIGSVWSPTRLGYVYGDDNVANIIDSTFSNRNIRWVWNTPAAVVEKSCCGDGRVGGMPQEACDGSRGCPSNCGVSVSDPFCDVNQPCNGRGTCDDGSCECDAGFSGNRCQTDDCAGNDCNGNGVCRNGQCECTNGFLGSNCQIDGFCAGNNCNGRGTCRNGRCECRSGFSGTNCQTDTACQNNDCNGRGTCSNGQCDCEGQWAGSSCNIDGFCATQPCRNNGRCTLGRCQCQSGFSGTFCEVEAPADFCDEGCNGNGVCNSAREQCFCNSGWEGDRCQTRSQDQGDFCSTTSCSGHGVCRNGQCQCESGWSGVECNECEACNHCANRPPGDRYFDTCCIGTCVEGRNGPTCEWSATHPDNSCPPPAFGDAVCWRNACYRRGVCYNRDPLPAGTDCGGGNVCDSSARCVSRFGRRLLAEEGEEAPEESAESQKSRRSSKYGAYSQVLRSAYSTRTRHYPNYDDELDRRSYSLVEEVMYVAETLAEEEQALQTTQAPTTTVAPVNTGNATSYTDPATLLYLTAVQACLSNPPEELSGPEFEEYIVRMRMTEYRSYFKPLCQQDEVLEDPRVVAYLAALEQHGAMSGSP